MEKFGAEGGGDDYWVAVCALVPRHHYFLRRCARTEGAHQLLDCCLAEQGVVYGVNQNCCVETNFFQGGLQGTELALAPLLVHDDFGGGRDAWKDLLGVRAQDDECGSQERAIFKGDVQRCLVAERG